MHILLILLTIFTFLVPSFGQAESNLFGDRTTSIHLEPNTHPHQEQWRHEIWAPGDWIVQRESGLALVQGFYDADIVRDQRMEEEEIPIVVVGPNFYHLGGFDKGRVMASLDAVYGITATDPSATIFLEDWHTGSVIGVFNVSGLVLQ